MLALVAALVCALAAAAAPASGQTLKERLDRALTVPGVSRSLTGAFVVNLDTGKTTYRLNGSRSLEPASNQKLVVALAALDRLGPGYRISTEVLGDGELTGSTWQGRIVLKGYGDPTLTRAKLKTLAQAVRAQGIRRVTGRIAGDESYFDKRRMANGWLPGWYKIESPPLSALVVDRAKVKGRTVDEPALAAARAFRRALVKAGVSVAGKAVIGPAPEDAVFLTRVRSGSTATLVHRMNKTSDNFIAEMLLKHMGAKLRGRGTTPAGAIVLGRVLESRGIPAKGVRLVDGSGLSPRNRLTARAVAFLLVSAWNDPALNTQLVGSLPVAGVDGTLRDRLRNGPARGHVRAKTGTTRASSSLSGYVRTRYAFSILVNGNPVSWTAARRAQDRVARALAAAAAP